MNHRLKEIIDMIEAKGFEAWLLGLSKDDKDMILYALRGALMMMDAETMRQRPGQKYIRSLVEAKYGPLNQPQSTPG